MDDNNKNNSVGDEYVIGEGFVVDEDAAEEVKPKLKKNAKKKAKTVGAVLFRFATIISIAVILAFLLILFFMEYLGIKLGETRDIVLEIPSGASTSKIAEILKEENAVNSALMFRVYTTLTGNNGKYKAGVYTFKNELGYSELADMLIEGGESGETTTVMIPERASIDDIAQLLVDNGVCTRADFIAAMDSDRYDYWFVDEIPEQSVYYRFEGYLFPDTYEFYCYDNSSECAELAIDKMLSRMEQELDKLDAKKKAEEMGYSVHEILTMASIVELEASGEPEEAKNVAQVFYNRLNDWEYPLLGSSPTAEYKYGKGRYDTNKVAGIPPGPYCSPSAMAIEAALEPNEECKATYFVTDKDMKFYYTHSLKEHNDIIWKLKKDGMWA